MKKFMEDIKCGKKKELLMQVIGFSIVIVFICAAIVMSVVYREPVIEPKVVDTEAIERVEIDTLELVYHKNSEDIVNAIKEYIDNSNIEENDYSDDAIIIRVIEQYVDDYLTDTYSDDMYDMEVDIFINLFKDELLRIDEIKKLIGRREIIYTAIKSFDEE